MKNTANDTTIIAALNFSNCPNTDVPEWDPASDQPVPDCLKSWETPLSPARFRRGSGLAVIEENGRNVLEFNKNPWAVYENERALVTGGTQLRNYTMVAEIFPAGDGFHPNGDRSDVSQTLVGPVFRWQDSRHYYQFGIEGRSRLVLYRRADDEWFPLASKEISAYDGYITLMVDLDGEGIRCRCPEKNMEFFCSDTTYASGKAGIRSHGHAKLAMMTISQDIRQQKSDSLSSVRRVGGLPEEENIPDAVVVKNFDLQALGGTPKFNDFITKDRFDMLVEGKTLRALDADGKVIWELAECVKNITFSKDFENGGRLLYGFTGFGTASGGVSTLGASELQFDPGEMIVIRGTDGKVLARGGLPAFEKEVRNADFSPTSGNLSGNGAFDIVLREWRSDCGNGGKYLWAFDRELNPIWNRSVYPPYGHHYAVSFFDAEGCDEVLAGGTLLSAEGNVIWTHDLAAEMDTIHSAGHYDSVAIGNFNADAELNPVAFLISGSAGVYVVDGKNGRTRMFHRVGHAQGREIGSVCNAGAGAGAEQVLVVCRWGTFGILNLFSGNGDRLWTRQPDYYGQGSCFVRWAGKSYIWMNTSAVVQSLYDGRGKKVKTLDSITRHWGDEIESGASQMKARLGTTTDDYLCLTVDGKLLMFGPESS